MTPNDLSVFKKYHTRKEIFLLYTLVTATNLFVVNMFIFSVLSYLCTSFFATTLPLIKSRNILTRFPGKHNYLVQFRVLCLPFVSPLDKLTP